MDPAIPGVDKIMGLVRGYLKIAVGLLDEVMLAHVLRTRAENPYQAAREALVLYAQNARPMMTNAAWVTALVWLLSGLVFVVMLVPRGSSYGSCRARPLRRGLALRSCSRGRSRQL